MSGRGLDALRWLVLAVWTASALGQIASEWRGRRLRPADPHPEIPAGEQERAVAVLRACQERVGRDDLLVVAGGEDTIEVFLRYRLAYLLYPAHVAGAPLDAVGLAEALHAPGRFRRRFALVLGEPSLTVEDATTVGITPADRLFEARP